MEEPTLNTTPSPARETEEEKRRKTLLPLFLLLLFFLLATSCIVGFLLGRTTEPGRFGALIDTIVLSPGEDEPSALPSGQPTPGTGESPAGEQDRRIDLVGVVQYTDKTPFTQGSVRLQSEPRYSQVNGQGRFQFDAVELGPHELTVLDRAGNELARRSIEVERDAVETAFLEYQNGICVMHIKLMTVEVDVEITLEEGPDGELSGDLDIKLVGTVEEEAVPALQTSVPPAEETRRPGSGETFSPAGEPTAAPGTDASGETAPAVPSTAPTATPGTAPGETPAVTPSAAPGETPGVPPTAQPSVSPAVMPSARPTASPKPSSRPDDDDDDDDDPPAPPPVLTGETEVYHGESSVTWEQQAVIDLFRPLDGSEALIAPGSEGYYLFRLENGRNGRVRFTLALREESFHVPLEYRITGGKDPSVEHSPWRTASMERETVSDGLELAAGTDGYYRIEWRWPFDGDDGVDTALGVRTDRIYTLKLTIRAEDVP